MDTWSGFFLVIIAILVISAAAREIWHWLKFNRPTRELTGKSSREKNIEYISKQYLSGNERRFLDSLKLVEKFDLIVVPQVNLATVIEKKGDFKWQSELYRNIDFGIFDHEYNLLLLIELNDSSHNQKKRQFRDIKVKDICQQAGIELMTFYTNMPNKAEYVVDRVVKKIDEIGSEN